MACDIRPGRRPRGPALRDLVREYQGRAGITDETGTRAVTWARPRPVTPTPSGGSAGYADHPPRMGFFTDTSVCIGCKACEVACKEWNDVPEDGLLLTGMSYDNTGGLSASTWRHVAFIEQPAAQRNGQRQDAGAARRVAVADVQPTSASTARKPACLDVCPTGALMRTEFGTVVVQDDICNGCGYCVSACPFGVIDRREADGRRPQVHAVLRPPRATASTPACAQGVPDRVHPVRRRSTSSVNGRSRRVDELHDAGRPEARLYGADPDDGVGGAGAFFLLLDEPEVYGLPPDPRGHDAGPASHVAARGASPRPASAAAVVTVCRAGRR